MKKILEASKFITCVKWTFFIFNVIFLLTGCGLIGLGIWLNVARNDWQGISDYNYISIANLAIAAGIIIVIIAFCGCIGAVTENKILMIVFFSFLLIIFIAEITIGVLGYLWRNKVDNELREQLEKRIPGRYYTEKAVKTAVNSLQEHFKCCGLNNLTDWSEEVPNMKRYIHKSCCNRDSNYPDYNGNCNTAYYDQIDANPKILSYYYSKGCYQSIKDFLKDNLWIIGLVGLIFGGFEIIGMAISMLLFCKLRRAEMY